MNSRELLAGNLRRLRRERGLTQRELALASGLNRSLVARYEQGETAPHRDCIAALAYALGVSMETLKGEELSLERDILAEFGQTLKSLRKSRGLTQKQLGEAIGVTAGTISTYECGIACPQKKNLAALANIFGVSASALLPQDATLKVYEDEIALISCYRSSDLQGRRSLLSAAESLSRPEPVPTQNSSCSDTDATQEPDTQEQ